MINAILFPIAYDKLLDRRKTRDDKSLSESVIERQYYSLQLPQLGEVDYIKVLGDNLS